MFLSMDALLHTQSCCQTRPSQVAVERTQNKPLFHYIDSNFLPFRDVFMQLLVFCQLPLFELVDYTCLVKDTNVCGRHGCLAQDIVCVWWELRNIST